MMYGQVQVNKPIAIEVRSHGIGPGQISFTKQVFIFCNSDLKIPLGSTKVKYTSLLALINKEDIYVTIPVCIQQCGRVRIWMII